MKTMKLSARTILISLVVLNCIGIVLSEVQRRALVQRQTDFTNSLIVQLDAVVPQLDQSLRTINTRLLNVEEPTRPAPTSRPNISSRSDRDSGQDQIGLNASASSTERKITGTQGVAGYEAANLFSDSSRGWEISGQQGWVGYELTGNPLKCKAYKMTAARAWLDRAPKDWTLDGSEDGQTWTLLDIQKNQQWAEKSPTELFDVNCPRAYRYFRWTILNNAGGPSVVLQKIVLQ